MFSIPSRSPSSQRGPGHLSKRSLDISPFENHLPVRIRFGEGVLDELPDLLRTAGSRRVAAIVDPNVRDLPAIAEALDASDAVVHETAQNEPTTASIEAAATWLSDVGADALVAIGGGSTIDTAKGARLVSRQGGPVTRFAYPDPEPIEEQPLLLVTVPTTAGTGSEVTGGIVAFDTNSDLKVGASSPHNRAQFCLVDPTLTWSLPPAPTLYGGIDALAQGLAAVVVRVHTPIGDALGLEAIRIAARALPALVRDPLDHDARAAMACASLLAGLAMNVAEAGTEHSLAHALGTLLHLPHGLTVGLVLAESLDHDRTFVPDRMERIADAVGEPPGSDPDGSRAPRAVRKLLAQIGFPTARDAGVEEQHVASLVDLALRGWIPVEPGPWSPADIEAAYRRALALTRRTAGA